MSIITVFSRKGGQGKSPISFGIVKANPSYYYLTNDEDGASLYLKLLNGKGALINDREPLQINFNSNMDIIYDGGGYTSDVTLDMMKHSQYIIIPTKLETRPIASTHKLLKEIKENKDIKAKIIVVVTQWDTDKYTNESQILIKKMFENLSDKIIFLRKTKIFEKIEFLNCSIDEYYEKNPLYRNNKIFEEWKDLMDSIK